MEIRIYMIYNDGNSRIILRRGNLDYILDVAEIIFEYSSWVIMLGVIFILGKLYKEREENEDFLILKLIGFYLLGCFTFNIDIYIKFIIPVGYGIYALGMKEKNRKNKGIKDKSANLGIIVLVIGIICSFIYNGLEYRDKFIKIENNSIKLIEDDYKLIEERLKLNDYIIPKDFRLSYYDDNIENISYSFISDDKYYNISKNKKDEGYNVMISKYSDEMNSYWNGFYNYNEIGTNKIEIKELLRAVSNIKFDTSKTDKEIVSYYLTYDEKNYLTGSEQVDNGDTTYYIEDYEKYTYKKAQRRELPMSGVMIWFSPMKEMSNNTEDTYGTESVYTDTYVLYPRKNKVLINDNISYLKINDLRNNKEEVLSIEDDYEKICNLLDSFDFLSWEEQNNDFNVQDDIALTINDDTDINLEFYKNQEYVRYTTNDENVIYKINKDIYNEVIKNIP